MSDWSQVRPFFETRAVVHLSTLMPDGAPHVTAVWAGPHGEQDLAFFTETGSRKAKNITADPRVALSVTMPGNDLAMAMVRGEVVRTVEGEEAMDIVDALSRLYTGKDYDLREGMTAYVIRPNRAWANDYAQE